MEASSSDGFSHSSSPHAAGAAAGAKSGDPHIHVDGTSMPVHIPQTRAPPATTAHARRHVSPLGPPEAHNGSCRNAAKNDATAAGAVAATLADAEKHDRHDHEEEESEEEEAEEEDEEDIVDELDLYCHTSALYHATPLPPPTTNAAPVITSNHSEPRVSTGSPALVEMVSPDIRGSSSHCSRSDSDRRSTGSARMHRESTSAFELNEVAEVGVAARQATAPVGTPSGESSSTREIEERRDFSVSAAVATAPMQAAPYAALSSSSPASPAPLSMSSAESAPQSGQPASVLMPEFDAELLQLIKNYYIRRQAGTAMAVSGSSSSSTMPGGGGGGRELERRSTSDSAWRNGNDLSQQQQHRPQAITIAPTQNTGVQRGGTGPIRLLDDGRLRNDAWGSSSQTQDQQQRQSSSAPEEAMRRTSRPPVQEPRMQLHNNSNAAGGFAGAEFGESRTLPATSSSPSSLPLGLGRAAPLSRPSSHPSWQLPTPTTAAAAAVGAGGWPGDLPEEFRNSNRAGQRSGVPPLSSGLLAGGNTSRSVLGGVSTMGAGGVTPTTGAGVSTNSGMVSEGLSALSSLPSYSSTSFVRAYVSDISLNLEPAIIVSALTAALNIVIVGFLQHHVLDTRDHLGLFLIGSYMIFSSYYMIYYFLERFSGSFRRIASQDKKFYIIGNLIKAGILISITPFACVHLVKIIVFDEWESNILRNLGCIYAIPDFISMVVVRRMRWSTWIHHACVVVFNYFSIMNNYQHENVCRCVVVYAAFSSFAYCVNVLLASRFLGVSVNVARVLSFVALVVYALCCAVNWAWQVYYLRRLLTDGHEHWTVYAYMGLISLVMWDDILLNKWLLHHARNNAYAAAQHLQQHRVRQQPSPHLGASTRASPLFRSQEERLLSSSQTRAPPRTL